MKQHHTKEHIRLKALAALAAFVLVLAGLYAGGRYWESITAKPETRGDPGLRLEYEDTAVIDGKTYLKRRSVTAVLLMGIDKPSGTATGYRNGGQADFLRLLVLDKQARTVTQLQIDRDTMTPIAILGVLGNRSGERIAQVSLSHGFGDGGKQSCELTAEAVSGLLYDTAIDHYMALDLHGIPALNDWAGGVTVTLTDDLSALDPAMRPGATLTLTGDQAETFVRSRMSVGEGTNASRMVRQQVYIDALNQKLLDRFRQDQESIGALYDTLSPHLTTDIARGALINIVWEAKDYQAATLTIPGEHRIGSDGFMQFHADAEALKQLVLDLFYEPLK